MADTVVINKGETVRFPVAASHPLAKYQSIKAPSDLPDLHGLAIVQTMVQKNPRITNAQLSTELQNILNHGLGTGILSILFPDITVEEGANLVFGGPVSTVSAGVVTVKGTITIYGSMNLACTELGG